MFHKLVPLFQLSYIVFYLFLTDPTPTLIIVKDALSVLVSFPMIFFQLNSQ